MKGERLWHLQVIGVRYRRTTPAVEDERGLDAYVGANVYAAVGSRFDIVERTISENEPSGDAIDDRG